MTTATIKSTRKHLARRLAGTLFALLVFLGIFAVLPLSVHAAAPIQDYASLAAALARGDVSITISGTIYVEDTLTIPENTTVEITGQNGAALQRVFTHNQDFALIENVYYDSSLLLNGVALKGAASNRVPCAAPVVVNNGYLYLNSSSVSGSYCAQSGLAAPGILNDAVVEMDSGATVYGNSSDVGGGIYSYNGGSVYMYGSSAVYGNASFGAPGGGISGEIVVLENTAKVHDNTAPYGGGIYSAHTLNMSNTASVYGNTCRYFGGGIIADGEVTIFDSARVYGNTAGEDGGGVFLTPGGFLHLYDQAVIGGTGQDDGNTAKNGGGVFLGGAQAEVFGHSKITGNNASRSGGAIAYTAYDAGETTTCWFYGNSTVSGNSARAGGAFAALEDTTGMHSVCFDENTVVTGNTATGNTGIMNTSFTEVYVSGSAQLGTANNDNGILVNSIVRIGLHSGLTSKARINICGYTAPQGTRDPYAIAWPLDHRATAAEAALLCWTSGDTGRIIASADGTAYQLTYQDANPASTTSSKPASTPASKPASTASTAPAAPVPPAATPAAGTLRVLYDVNHDNLGTSQVHDQTGFKSGDKVTVRSDVPTRAGYSFISWNTRADGKGTAYRSGNTFIISGTTTLYAQWSPLATTPATGTSAATGATSTTASAAGASGASTLSAPPTALTPLSQSEPLSFTVGGVPTAEAPAKTSSFPLIPVLGAVAVLAIGLAVLLLVLLRRRNADHYE